MRSGGASQLEPAITKHELLTTAQCEIRGKNFKMNKMCHRSSSFWAVAYDLCFHICRKILLLLLLLLLCTPPSFAAQILALRPISHPRARNSSFEAQILAWRPKF